MKLFLTGMLLICLAAAPATKPDDRPFKEVKDLIAALPNDVKPDKGEAWSKANFDLANDWFAKNVVDRKCVFTYKLSKANGEGEGSVTLTAPDVREDGLPLRLPQIQATLADGEKIKLAKIKSGDTVQLSGAIESVKVEQYAAGKGTLRMKLQQGVIERKK